MTVSLLYEMKKQCGLQRVILYVFMAGNVFVSPLKQIKPVIVLIPSFQFLHRHFRSLHGTLTHCEIRVESMTNKTRIQTNPPPPPKKILLNHVCCSNLPCTYSRKGKTLSWIEGGGGGIQSLGLISQLINHDWIHKVCLRGWHIWPGLNVMIFIRTCLCTHHVSLSLFYITLIASELCLSITNRQGFSNRCFSHFLYFCFLVRGYETTCEELMWSLQ